MLIRNIFVDLDGTLLDIRARLYNLFVELAPETQFDFDEYWELKRNGLDQAIFLAKYLYYSAVQIAEFKTMWLSRIEE